jgi:hypothetical protein
MSTVSFRLNAEEGTLSIAAEDKGVFLTMTDTELDIVLSQLGKMRAMMKSQQPVSPPMFPAWCRPQYMS